MIELEVTTTLFDEGVEITHHRTRAEVDDIDKESIASALRAVFLPLKEAADFYKLGNSLISAGTTCLNDEIGTFIQAVTDLLEASEYALTDALTLDVDVLGLLDEKDVFTHPEHYELFAKALELALQCRNIRLRNVPAVFRDKLRGAFQIPVDMWVSRDEAGCN